VLAIKKGWHCPSLSVFYSSIGQHTRLLLALCGFCTIAEGEDRREKLEMRVRRAAERADAQGASERAIVPVSDQSKHMLYTSKSH